MTKARMNWRRLKLDLEGHADSAPYGKDIVCAAESMLTQALLQTLLDMQEKHQLMVDWSGSPESGTLHMETYPVKEHWKEAEACYRVAVTGLRMLTERYPKHINLEEE